MRRIVQAAVMAPSAENTQPWQFAVDRDTLIIFLDMTRTLESDLGHMLSLTAIGASIENAAIAATVERLHSNVQILVESAPTQGATLHVPIAEIRFVEGATRDPLVDQIESRSTGRRMDHRRQVDADKLDQLTKSCDAFTDASVHWVGSRQLREFSHLIGIGNRIRLEYQPFHQELYHNLRFTTAEADRTRDGLDVATLQLPPGLSKILAALRTWPRMKWANLLGFSRFVARQAAQEVYRSGAVGILSVGGPESQQFVQGGRALERVWLTATCLGLCFHPTASLPVFMAYANAGAPHLSSSDRSCVADMSERFYGLFPELSGRTVQMAFRVGYGPTPHVRSLRRSIDEVLQFK